MSINKKSNGCSLNWTVTGADVASGDLVMVGNIPGVANADAVVGAEVTLDTEGVFELPKVNGAVNQGDKLYYDPVALKLTTAEDNAPTSPLVSYVYVGRAWKAAGNLAATVECRLTEI